MNDTQLYMSFDNISDTEQVIKSIISDIREWMKSKQLKLNENKTVFSITFTFTFTESS